MSPIRTVSAQLALTLFFVSGCGDSPTDPNGDTGPVVAQVILSTDTLWIPAVGYERTLEAMAFGENGQTLIGVELVWGTRNPIVAQVNSSGTVVGRDLGATLLTVSAQGVADTASVQVIQVPAVITFDAPDTLRALGQRAPLHMSMTDSAGVAMEPQAEFSSSDNSVVFASDANGPGVVKAIGPGTAVVTATFRGVSESVEVVVKQLPVLVWLAGNKSALNLGDTTTLPASVYDPRNAIIEAAEIEWSTSDPAVITASDAGVLTAVGGGNVVITARHGDLTDRRGLTVHAEVVPTGTLNVDPTSWLSDTFAEEMWLRAFVADGVGPSVAVPATWTSRDPAIVKVTQQSVATTQGNGMTWLVAQYEGQTDSIAVEVNRVPVSLRFTTGTQVDIKRLSTGNQLEINLTDGVQIYSLAVDRLGTITSTGPTWTVRDASVLEIDSRGIHGLRAGATWIVGAAEGLIDSIAVTVAPLLWEDYAITNLADLERFEGMGVEDMVGTLRIHGTSLTSLSGLESLRTVWGDVSVKFNGSLEDVSGLHLESVRGNIIIEKNPYLNPSLPTLIETDGLAVFDNLRFNQSIPFPDLAIISERLYLGDRGDAIEFPSLVSAGSIVVEFQGPAEIAFPTLERVYGPFSFVNTPETVTISAPRLWRTQHLYVSGNTALMQLNLSGLSTVQRNLTISANPLLPNLDGLRGLTSGLWALRIMDNAALTSVNGLRQLGDALGSNPIGTEASAIEYNPLLPSSNVGDLRIHLHNKYPGPAFPNGLRSQGNGP